MRAFNKKNKPKNITFPRYKDKDYTTNRNTKKLSVHSQFREGRILIYEKYSFQFNYSGNKIRSNY